MNSDKQLQTQKKTTNVPSRQQNLNLRQIAQTTHPASILQRARADPDSLTPADVLQLQRTIGNQAVGQLLNEIGIPSKAAQQGTVQRQEPEEEELLQGKSATEYLQCQIPEEEEELVQGKFAETIQKQGPEKELKWNGKVGEVLQRATVRKAVVPNKRTFQAWWEQAAGGSAMNNVFGVTNAYSMKRTDGGELEVEMWEHWHQMPPGWHDVDDVETDADNWKDKIDGLASMGIPELEKPKWYSKEAVKAHEDEHYNSFAHVVGEFENKELERLPQDFNHVGMVYDRRDRSIALSSLRAAMGDQGNEDHLDGTTDEAESAKVVDKIAQIWDEVVGKRLISQAGPRLGIPIESYELQSPYRAKRFRRRQPRPEAAWIVKKLVGRKTIRNIKLLDSGDVAEV